MLSSESHNPPSKSYLKHRFCAIIVNISPAKIFSNMSPFQSDQVLIFSSDNEHHSSNVQINPIQYIKKWMIVFYVLFQVSNRIARIRLLAPAGAGWLSLETSRRVRSPCHRPPPRTPPSSPPSWAQPRRRPQEQHHRQLLQQEQLHRRHLR